MAVMNRTMKHLFNTFLTRTKFQKNLEYKLLQTIQCAEDKDSNIRINNENFPTIDQAIKDMRKKVLARPKFHPILMDRRPFLNYAPNFEDLPKRSLRDSFTSVIVPLSNNQTLQDQYVSSTNQVRLGQILYDFDYFSAWVICAYINIKNPNPNAPPNFFPFTIFTLLIDHVHFFSDYVAKSDLDIRLTGHIAWIGNSSLEIVLWAEQFYENKWRKIAIGFYLMVVKDAVAQKSLNINPLVFMDEEDRTIFAIAEARQLRRLNRRKQSIFTQIPSDDEQTIIYDLFAKSINPKNIKFNSQSLPSNAIWMADTILSSGKLLEPETRNPYDVVFGGVYLRDSLELSFATASQVSKSLPKLLHMADIQFFRPLRVGVFCKLHAQVIYTQGKFMQIAVFCEVYDAKCGQHNTTSVYHFTYESTDDSLPEIQPKTYQEAIWYLEGKRKLNFVMESTDALNESSYFHQ